MANVSNEEDQWRNVTLYILKLIHSLETGVRNGNWNCPSLSHFRESTANEKSVTSGNTTNKKLSPETKL